MDSSTWSSGPTMVQSVPPALIWLKRRGFEVDQQALRADG
jgi:hypothetical protein